MNAHTGPSRQRLLRVLLIEDHEDDALIVQSLVGRSQRNMECVWLSSADEALEALATTEFDLVLLGDRPAPVSGLHLLRRIHESASSVPIVLLTQTADPATNDDAAEHGARAAVRKEEMSVQWLEGTIDALVLPEAPEHEEPSISAHARACAAAGVGLVHLRHGTIVACDATASDVLGGSSVTLIGASLASVVQPAADVEGSIALPRDDSESYLLSPNGTIVRARVLECAEQGAQLVVVTDASEECARRGLLLQAWRDGEAFAYGASHDLQGPLRRIVMFSEAVIEDVERAPQAALDYARRAARSAREMSRLTVALLDYSRSGSHHHPLRPTSVDLELATHAAVAAARSQEALRDAAGRVEVDVTGVAWGDVTITTHILEALARNALVYRRQGEAADVAIRSRCSDGFIEISVSDRGIGFEPDQEQRVFLPFERLVSRSDYTGMGLGLCTARRWARRMGGDVRLQHVEPGSGTTFVLRLPAHEETPCA